MKRLSLRSRNTSAVGEIVAAILMLLLVVSIGTAVFAYSTNGLGSFSNNFSNLLSNQGEAVSQQFSVDFATFNSTSGLPLSQLGVNLYVRNGGSSPITIATIYIQNLTSNAFVGSFALTPTVTIQPGSFQSIAVHFVPDAGGSYQFTIVTTLGTKELSTFQA